MSQPKQYIISLTQLHQEQHRLVGQRAILLGMTTSLGISVPAGFVVTSQVFDDFILGSDLVGFISSRINNVNYADDEQVRKYSLEIQQAIKKAEIPELLATKIEKAYAGLGGLFEAYVRIQTSPIEKELNEANYSKIIGFENIKGVPRLFETIKDAWSKLFTYEAMKHRASVGYEGTLSQALIVQKHIHAEVSGMIFTNSVFNSEKITEIQALFGIIPEEDQSTHVDLYFYQPKTEKIVEKRINPQSRMFLRKGRSENGSLLTDVVVSSAWQKKQKLDDSVIVAIGRIATSLTKLLKTDLHLVYSVESGRVYIESILSGSDIKLEDIEIAKTDENFLSPINQPVDPIEVKQQEKQEEIVVVLKPINELTPIATGIAMGINLVYGLIHKIDSASDWEDLTGDEILVIKNFDISKIQEINSVKGLIIESVEASEDLSEINVPVIFSIKNIADLVKENEVVTLDPKTGKLYAGAGKENPQTKEITEKEIKEDSEAKNNSILKENIEITEQKTSSGPFLLPIIDKQSKKDSLYELKTAIDFYQAYNVLRPGLIKVGRGGVYVDMNQFYKGADLNPEYLLTEPELRRPFIKHVVEVLQKILVDFESLPVILKANNLEFDELKLLGGNKQIRFEHKNFSGAGKFVLNPSLLEQELEIVSILRNRENLRNLWLSIPNINTSEELAEVKKIISSFGFRRSATFKLVGEVNEMIGMLSIKNIVENELDMIIINLEKIIEQVLNGKEYDYNEDIAKFISWVIQTINSSNTKPAISYNNLRLAKDTYKLFIKNGLENVVLPPESLFQTQMLVSEFEVKELIKSTKPGRKKKEIDYGF